MNKENVADDRFISQCNTQSSNSVREYSDPIPVDLLIDIFSRVSAKSIARFRCVSKFWAYILRRPDFTELFLTKSFTRPRFLFSFKVKQELFVFSAPQPQNLDENSSLVATRYKYFPEYFPTGISPPLCGLVLLHSRTEGNQPHVISNPVTGESITLPKVKGTGINISYLGFDPISKKFKVLCKTLSGTGLVAHTHRILTLETGKRLWRTIQDPIFLHFPYVGEICINGVLYYQADFEGSSVIVCFDVRSENFEIVNKDRDMLRQNLWNLFNYKGKLGAHGFVNRNKGEFVLWVLEDARKHKWSKIICVLPPFLYKAVDGNYNFKYVGISGTSEIVFSRCFVSNPFYLFYNNVERKTFTIVQIKGFEEFKDHRIVVSSFLDYVENMKFIMHNSLPNNLTKIPMLTQKYLITKFSITASEDVKSCICSSRLKIVSLHDDSPRWIIVAGVEHEELTRSLGRKNRQVEIETICSAERILCESQEDFKNTEAWRYGRFEVIKDLQSSRTLRVL